MNYRLIASVHPERFQFFLVRVVESLLLCCMKERIAQQMVESLTLIDNHVSFILQACLQMVVGNTGSYSEVQRCFKVMEKASLA